MRIQGPVLGNLPFQAKLFTIGRQQKLNRCSIKANAVIKRLHLMFSINTLDRHHAHQDLQFSNILRITGKQCFQCVRFFGLYNDVDPGRWNIGSR
ncbi:hypothetical protein D1872_226560 [compost metagenome]